MNPATVPTPADTTTFQSLVMLAYSHLHAYSEDSDKNNLALVAHGVGRADGFCLAFGTPPEWKPILDELDAKAMRLGVM